MWRCLFFAFSSLFSFFFFWCCCCGCFELVTEVFLDFLWPSSILTHISSELSSSWSKSSSELSAVSEDDPPEDDEEVDREALKQSFAEFCLTVFIIIGWERYLRLSERLLLTAAFPEVGGGGRTTPPTPPPSTPLMLSFLLLLPSLTVTTLLLPLLVLFSPLLPSWNRIFEFWRLNSAVDIAGPTSRGVVSLVAVVCTLRSCM